MVRFIKFGLFFLLCGGKFKQKYDNNNFFFVNFAALLCPKDSLCLVAW